MATSRKDKRVAELKDDVLQKYRESGVAPLVEEILATFLAKVAYRRTVGEDYRILGVEPDDPPELMEKVWRAKALYYHPDTPKTGNREAYERVTAAYQRIKGEGG